MHSVEDTEAFIDADNEAADSVEVSPWLPARSLLYDPYC